MIFYQHNAVKLSTNFSLVLLSKICHLKKILLWQIVKSKAKIKFTTHCVVIKKKYYTAIECNYYFDEYFLVKIILKENWWMFAWLSAWVGHNKLPKLIKYYNYNYKEIMFFKNIS